MVWFVGTGLVLFGRAIDVFKPRGSFQRVVVASLGLTALIEGFVNLYVSRSRWSSCCSHFSSRSPLYWQRLRA